MNKKLLSIIALILAMCFVLVGCGEAIPEEKPHEHTFESGDTWEKNDKGHWHKALCDHDDLIADFDDHNDVNDDGVCDDCGYSDPTHTHTYDTRWEHDAKKHWNKTTCVHTGIIGNEAPHTPDMLGVCTVCGYLASKPDLDSVEDAVEVGISQKDSVASGTVASASGDSENYSVDQTDYYEFRSSYLYVSSVTPWSNSEYYYTMTDTGVLGVQIASDGSFERFTAVDGNLLGPNISDGFIGYIGEGYYGTENLVEKLYEIATDKKSSNGDLVESVVNGVYTFSFGYYAQGSLYVITVVFTLDAEAYIFDSVTVVSHRYYEDDIEMVTEANEAEGIPATYKVKDGAEASYMYGISIQQYTEIPNPIDPDEVLMKDFVLVDGEGELIEDTITIEKGEKTTITFAAIEPITSILKLNEITFNGEGVNPEYDLNNLTPYMQGLMARYYVGNDFFTLETNYAPAGTTFDLTMTVNGIDYNYKVVVTESIPTQIFAGVVGEHWVKDEDGNEMYVTGNEIITSTTDVEINEGESVMLAAHTDKRVVVINVALSPETEIDLSAYGTRSIYDEKTEKSYDAAFIDLSYLPTGEYVVTFTVDADSSLTKSINVKVNEKVDQGGDDEDEGGLSGTYKLVNFYDHNNVSPFIYVIDEATQTVVYINGTTEKTFTYYVEGDVLIFMDGTTPQYQYAYSITLDENGVPYEAYCSGNAVRYALVKEKSAPSIEGAGTADDPYIIPGEGNYEGYSIEGDYVYFTYTATEDVTFNLEFTGDDYFLEYGTFSFNYCTPHTAKTFTTDLTSGTTLYLKVATAESNTANVPFTVSFGTAGGDDEGGDDEPVTTGTLTVEEVTVSLDIAGTYTYTIDANNVVTIYDASGNETDIIGFMYADGAFIFTSSSLGVNMTLGMASLVDANSNTVTALEGTISLRQGPSVLVNFTFTEGEGGEDGEDPIVPDDTEIKDSLEGTYEFDDFTISMYMNFWSGNHLFEVTLADWTTYGYTYAVTDNGDGTVTIVVTAIDSDDIGFASKTIIATRNEYIGWVLSVDGVEQNVDPVCESLKENFATTPVEGGTAEFSMAYVNGEYLYAIFVYNDSYSTTCYYLYTINENVDGTFTATFTDAVFMYDDFGDLVACDDAFGLVDKTITAVYADGSWTVSLDGYEGGSDEEPEGDPIKDSIKGTYNLGDYTVYIYQSGGEYYFNTYDNLMTFDNYYTFTVTENADGTLSIVPTYCARPDFETGVDELGIDGKTFIATPDGEGGWTLALAEEGGEEEEPSETENITIFDGTGSKDDPYVITAGGSYFMAAVDDYPGQFIMFTATETITITISADVAEIYPKSFSSKYAEEGASYTFTLNAGESVVFTVCMELGDSDVVLTVSYSEGEEGGEDEEPTVVEEGYFVVVDGGNGLGVDGTYNYTLYSDNTVVITLDGVETGAIILEMSEDGYWTVSSVYIGIMMTIGAPAPLFAEDANPITELDGVAHVMQMPSKYVFLTFYFNTQPEGGEGGEEEPELYSKLTELKDGDVVIIVADAYKMALSADKVSSTSYYNKGVDYTNGFDAITDAELFVVTVNDDGTYTFTSKTGKVIALADSYASLNDTGAHNKWTLEETSTEGAYYVYNEGRDTYLEWYASMNNWSTYYKNSDAQFEISFLFVERA